MKRLATLTLLGYIAAPGFTAYAADATSIDEQTISNIEHDWNEASKTKNKAFFEKYLSDDFTFINESGEFSEGQTAYIDQVMKLPKLTELAVTDEKIRVHGSTAAATGRLAYKANNKSTATRYTDTFAKGPDGWKAIASQETTTKDGERVSKPPVSATNPAGQPAGKRLY